MTDTEQFGGAGMSTAAGDPRVLLADYANGSDEWVRYVVGEVLANGARPSETTIAEAYALFRQEKALDERVLPGVPKIATAATEAEQTAPLSIVRLSDVHGVNALLTGSVIEPHNGLTVIYAENGTGKTGYSRIFKALAESRTADEILGDIASASPEPPSAKIDYKLGGEAESYQWHGETGVPPFTRMSVFDSRSVSYHVDDDLDYVYTPAALALFEHVIAGLQGVLARIEGAVRQLRTHDPRLLTRFPRDSTAYPLIEALGASSDLNQIQALGDHAPNFEARLESLRQTVAALEANTIRPKLDQALRESRVLTEAQELGDVLASFDVATYNNTVTKRAGLMADYDAFRTELFAAADLPADPDETWSDFIAAGDAYRAHLTDLGVHDDSRCVYCRQELAAPARELLTKYATYLADRIRADIAAADQTLAEFETTLSGVATTDVSSFRHEYAERDDKPDFFDDVAAVTNGLSAVRDPVSARTAIDYNPNQLEAQGRAIAAKLAATTEAVDTLKEQLANRTSTLVEKRKELAELEAGGEITRSWADIERIVMDAKEADRLTTLRGALPRAQRAVTELAKTASNELINNNFDFLFTEECEKLRAPSLKVQFVGREGRAKRRKVLNGTVRPSRVLSEGEQKVLAMADFLAESQLAGITAPVIFDDPVSSLDHRRIREVSGRIANLAEVSQVIVFTHDILFTSHLLALFEKSKRCSFFEITDEAGKGQVTPATGPRGDTLKSLRGRINSTIQAAQAQQGEARAALVHQGYSHIRSWCELFTEEELLNGVVRRYEANVRMTTLSDIKTDRLSASIATVAKVFNDACRYTDAHSQPLITSAVQPTLAGLEEDWKALQECRSAYIAP